MPWDLHDLYEGDDDWKSMGRYHFYSDDTTTILSFASAMCIGNRADDILLCELFLF